MFFELLVEGSQKRRTKKNGTTVEKKNEDRQVISCGCRNNNQLKFRTPEMVLALLAPRLERGNSRESLHLF